MPKPSAPSRSRARRSAAGRQEQQRQPGDEHRRAEEDRPVVRVQRDRQRDAEQHRPAPRAGARRRCRRAGRARCASKLSSTTSEYIRVSCAYCERNGLQRGQHRREPGGAAAEHEPGAPERDAGSAAARTAATARAWRARRCSSSRDPEVQQHVVERRRAVLAQDARDVGQRPVGDPDRQPLVDPVADAQLARAQPEAPPDEQREADGHDDPRARERRGPAAPTPGVRRRSPSAAG